MTRRFASVLAVSTACLLAACGGSSDAQKTAAVLTGDAKGAASDNPQCRLFTPDEIETYMGEPASAGENAATGMGCQWLAADGSGDVIISVVPSEYHETPSMQDGYKTLPDVPTEGFVAPYMDGWLAGAIVGKEAVRVSVAGSGASEATTVALLKDAIRRRAG